MTTAELREYLFSGNHFAAVSLGDRSEKLSFLLRGKGEAAFLVSNKDSHESTLLLGHALQHDLAAYVGHALTLHRLRQLLGEGAGWASFRLLRRRRFPSARHADQHIWRVLFNLWHEEALNLIRRAAGTAARIPGFLANQGPCKGF